ncbi:MAG: DUF4340 domain-containing protein [Planctomycetota bacterium]
MNRLTPILLVAVVGLLGWLALRQSEYEAENPLDQIELLFPDVDPARLVGLRLENIRDDGHFRFEHDGAGRWYLVDPMRWPADMAQLGEVLEVIQLSKAEPVPEALVEGAAASFEPPLGFIETRERMDDGTERLVRVEVGAVDLDGIRMFVRRDGRLYRSNRKIEYAFQIDLVDLREKRLFVAGGSVVDIERIGGWPNEEELVPLGFRISAATGNWRITDPVQAPAEPNLVGAWLNYIRGLKADTFANDRPDADLSKYGLAPPSLTIRVTNTSGGGSTLNVGTTANGGIFAQREGLPTVFRLDQAALPFLTESTSHFYDMALVRFAREEVVGLSMARGGLAMRFAPDRRERGKWLVHPLNVATGEKLAPRPADADRIERLLTELAKGELLDYVTTQPAEELFERDSATDTRVVLARTSDVPLEFRISADRVVRNGTELVPVYRTGDSLACVIAPELADLFVEPLEHYLDRYIWQLSNASLRKLELRLGDGEPRTWVRAQSYDWKREDTDEPARELDPVLDHLLFLRADRHLPSEERNQLTDPVSVRFTDEFGRTSEARVGRAPDGTVRIEQDAGQALAVRPELHADLLEVLGG